VCRTPLNAGRRAAAGKPRRLLVGDERGIVPVLQIRHPLQQTPRDQVGKIHRRDVVGKIGAAGIDDRFPVYKIEMIQRRRGLASAASRSESREYPLVLFRAALRCARRPANVIGREEQPPIAPVSRR